MTRSIDRRQNTVPIGGNLYMRVNVMTVDAYEQGGEALTPQDLNFRRFVSVTANATSNDDVVAKWVEGQQAIRLIDASTGAELAAGETQDVVLECIGV